MSGLGDLNLDALSPGDSKCCVMKGALVCILILVVLYLLVVCTSMMSSSTEGMKRSKFIPKFKA